MDDVRIPVDNLIGDEDLGFYYFMESLGHCRITFGAQAVGAASAALEATRDYATGREQLDHAIGDF